jgi:lon-related putative ATP-dependent protease
MSRPAVPGAPAALAPTDLYVHADGDLPAFADTREIADLDRPMGQERALQALEFGVGMREHGYNLFVLGPSGSRRRRITEDFLRREAPKLGTPSDWCYLNNFADERKPVAVRLPAGRGGELKHDMAQLVAELKTAIPAAFESEHYRSSLAELNQELEERNRAALQALQEEAERNDLSLLPTPHGFGLAPLHEGKLLPNAEFESLPADERARAEQRMAEMSEKVRHHVEQLPRWHKEQRERVAALNRTTTELAAAQPIEQLERRYAEFPVVVAYLAAVREDVLQNARAFLPEESVPAPLWLLAEKRPLVRYSVNLLVAHGQAATAPIVYESRPSVQNLLGRVEHVAELGALLTNFSMIRAGALHRANGGYLILDAEHLLLEPFAWSALKRALHARELRIESLGELLSLLSTVSLDPEPVPLDVKVILIGERRIYYLLCELDPDFADLFKVAADFENSVQRTAETTDRYARLVATVARQEGLLPLDRGAVARVVEHGARLVGDAHKLTTRVRDIADLLREANYWARRETAVVTTRAHVQRALETRVRRLDRVRDEVQDGIRRNLVLIDTSGAKIGQVNGLSVLGLGSFVFGQPSRITATVRQGDGEIVDIERETELGGPIHSKGVLILSAYLGAKYATDLPLSLGASLVFEQSYAGVEGDSASVAETCALLSALAEVPISQSLAVTGSVNQHGVVQAIGGVNEKIEGFFDTCRQRGLDGSHGVLIPRDNVPHLMLRDDVVAAAAAGQFHIYPIASIDEAIVLVTGIPAGERDAAGAFPAGSVNERVEARLRALAHTRREYQRGGGSQATQRGKRGTRRKPRGARPRR